MRNPLHSICPYFAMFPETFVQNQLLAYSQPGDQVFDPFCGRGTTVLEALLNNRRAIGMDINPVAVCIAGAKADIPGVSQVLERIDALARGFLKAEPVALPEDEFFTTCFSNTTLRQILFLQRALDWQTDRIDRFVAALILGVLHGESHRTTLCLSNRMPRTISTKPRYSVRWWKLRNLRPPERNVFDVLRQIAVFRLSGEIPPRRGAVALGDARSASILFPKYRGGVALLLTSPPYLDTTDYAEDQWLRLWFLGGPSHPAARLHRDDRHTRVDDYWSFLSEVWAGCAEMLREEAHLVVRIGGTILDKYSLFNGLLASLESGLAGRKIRALHNGETTTIRRRQTNSFRPGTSPEKREHDFAFVVT